jgi:hypothetical protein
MSRFALYETDGAFGTMSLTVFESRLYFRRAKAANLKKEISVTISD